MENNEKYKLVITKLPDRKCSQLLANKIGSNENFVLAYFLTEERKNLFLKSLSTAMEVQTILNKKEVTEEESTLLKEYFYE